MTQANDKIRDRLRELERAFKAFDSGDRSRLFESRDALTALSEAVEEEDSLTLGPICEIASRLLGMVLMEGKLTEARAVQVVRELLGYVEAQVLTTPGAAATAGGPGGVFHVVNSEKVGSLLLRRGLIQPAQLEKALLLQRVSKGKRVGEVLIAMNAIDPRTLEAVLDSQKAETRRAETRRASGGAHAAPMGPAGPTLKMQGPFEPIPPMPGAQPNPLPALPTLPDATVHMEPTIDPRPPHDSSAS